MVGMTSIRPSSGMAVYPHMPKASTADRRQSPTVTASAPSVKGTGVYRQYLPPSADSSDFGLLRAKFPKMGNFLASCPGRR